jgi:hypothetical protein
LYIILPSLKESGVVFRIPWYKREKDTINIVGPLSSFHT